MANDPKDLQEYRKMYPAFDPIPDEEFHYVNGEWFISLNGMKQLAFLFKRPDLARFAQEVSEK